MCIYICVSCKYNECDPQSAHQAMPLFDCMASNLGQVNCSLHASESSQLQRNWRYKKGVFRLNRFNGSTD